MTFLFGKRIRPITPYDVPAAPPPNPELEEELNAGRIRLQHNMLTVERSIASSQEAFAKIAADEIRKG